MRPITVLTFMWRRSFFYVDNMTLYVAKIIIYVVKILNRMIIKAQINQFYIWKTAGYVYRAKSVVQH